MAAWHGHRDAVQLLINTGACLSATNKVLQVFQVSAKINFPQTSVTFPIKKFNFPPETLHALNMRR